MLYLIYAVIFIGLIIWSIGEKKESKAIREIFDRRNTAKHGRRWTD